MVDKHRRRAIQYLIMASILWSTGGLLIKLIDWNPLAIAGSRSAVAAIVIYVFLRTPKIQLTKPKLLGACAYTALVILFVSANKMTTSANAILLQFTAPVWVALFSRWFLHERVRLSDWVTIFVVFGGMALFFVGDIEIGHMTGNGLAIASGLAMGAMVILLKQNKDSHPVEITLIGNVLTFIVCLPFLFGVVPTLGNVLGLVFMGVFQLGLSYILYTTAIQYVSAIEAILITALEPLLNPIWVFWATGEAPSGYAVVGGLIVLGAIVGRGVYQNRKNTMGPRIMRPRRMLKKPV